MQRKETIIIAPLDSFFQQDGQNNRPAATGSSAQLTYS